MLLWHGPGALVFSKVTLQIAQEAECLHRHRVCKTTLYPLKMGDRHLLFDLVSHVQHFFGRPGNDNHRLVIFTIIIMKTIV